MNRKELLLFLVVAVLLIIEFVVFSDLPFFWDGISKANRATWIYENNFSNLILPTEYSSGHPPLWITSLALFWKLFGQTLFSSRLLLLLVNLGVFYQILLLCKRNFSVSVPIVMFLLVCLDPTVLAQTTSLNNDMMLLFFTLFAFNALQKNSWLLYAIALSGLLLTNLRGIYCFVALLLIHIIYNRRRLLTFNRNMIYAYCIAVFTFGIFLIYQYSELGWVLITKNENFSEHRKTTTFMLMVKNTIVYFKNLLDFGRIFLWVPLVFFLWKVFRQKKFSLDVPSQRIFIALLVFTIVFFFGFVPFSNPMGPRYLMVCFILSAILLINVFFTVSANRKRRRGVLIIVAVALISGHFWIYPATISQAWDSSFAHLGYFSKEEKMLKFLEKENIRPSEVGTHLRFNGRRVAYLSKDKAVSEMFPVVDLTTNTYVILSNIENSTSDETILELRNNWEEVKTYENLGVFVTLYKNPKE